MSSRTYLCIKCGALRRASAVYCQHRQSPEEARTFAAWPKHCGQAMQVLTDEQGAAATHLDGARRIGWAASGLHILRRGGRRKWRPALNARQIEHAKQQLAAFHES